MNILIIFVFLTSCRTPEIDLTVRDGETSMMNNFKDQELINRLNKIEKELDKKSRQEYQRGYRLDAIQKQITVIKENDKLSKQDDKSSKQDDELFKRLETFYENLSRVVNNLETNVKQIEKELDKRIFKLEVKMATKKSTSKDILGVYK